MGDYSLASKHDWHWSKQPLNAKGFFLVLVQRLLNRVTQDQIQINTDQVLFSNQVYKHVCFQHNQYYRI